MTSASHGGAGRPIIRSDIVLIPFPFTDLHATKLRPATVVSVNRRHSDLIVAFVSSRGWSRIDAGEVAILPTHPEFEQTGLAAPSKIRTSKLVTLSTSLLRRWLGRLGPLLTADLDRALVAALSVNPVTYREDGRREERARLAALYKAGGRSALLADLGSRPDRSSARK